MGFDDPICGVVGTVTTWACVRPTGRTARAASAARKEQEKILRIAHPLRCFECAVQISTIVTDLYKNIVHIVNFWANYWSYLNKFITFRTFTSSNPRDRRNVTQCHRPTFRWGRIPSTIVMLHSNCGRPTVYLHRFPLFKCKVIALKSRTFVVKLLFSELFGVVFQSYLAYSGGPLQREPSVQRLHPTFTVIDMHRGNSLYRVFCGSTSIRFNPVFHQMALS
jgi:hypothetical protein